MLRINLLPPYVFDKQKKNKWVGVWALAVLAVICVFLYLNNKAVNDQEEAKKDQDAANALLTQKTDLDTKTAAVKSRIAQTQQKQDFIAAAQNWNDEWWKLYSVMRDVTSPKVILRKMYMGSPTVVNIVGWAPSEKEAADWWIDFRNKYTGANSPFSNVSFELPKNGWPPNADNANTPGAPGGASAPRGGPVLAGVQSAGGSGGFGSSPSSGGAGANDKDEEPGPGYLEDRLGIYFRVHVTLKTPFDGGKTVPVWGAPDASAGAGAPGAMALPGGAPRGGPPPGGAPPAASGDDSGGGGKKSKRGGGGEE